MHERLVGSVKKGTEFATRGPTELPCEGDEEVPATPPNIVVMVVMSTPPNVRKDTAPAVTSVGVAGATYMSRARVKRSQQMESVGVRETSQRLYGNES